MKIAISIADTGYFGLFNVILLVQHNEVISLGITPENSSAAKLGKAPD